jgi:hypothetical protein
MTKWIRYRSAMWFEGGSLDRHRSSLAKPSGENLSLLQSPRLRIGTKLPLGPQCAARRHIDRILRYGAGRSGA